MSRCMAYREVTMLEVKEVSFDRIPSGGQAVDVSALIARESRSHDQYVTPLASPLPVPLWRPPPARPREPRPAPAARRVQENREAAEARQARSALPGLAVQGVGRLAAGPRHVIVAPDTVLRWQRRRFRDHWTTLSGRPTAGRPPVNAEVRALVARMAKANRLWGAPRIHGELQKLGIDVAERTVSRLLPKRRSPPPQTWRTFLTNHVRDTCGPATPSPQPSSIGATCVAQ